MVFLEKQQMVVTSGHLHLEVIFMTRVGKMLEINTLMTNKNITMRMKN